ncbi:uncharacterized protein [Physcomitrium patens]|uniref:Uncharacterized protein n=1 Tax=Physcomitrium patens TaxID=3218 RepID=A9RIW1_PHYPA|nr:hypothetical protein PHYPA_026939 [Physcomitrium patens]
MRIKPSDQRRGKTSTVDLEAIEPRRTRIGPVCTRSWPTVSANLVSVEPSSSICSPYGTGFINFQREAGRAAVKTADSVQGVPWTVRRRARFQLLTTIKRSGMLMRKSCWSAQRSANKSGGASPDKSRRTSPRSRCHPRNLAQHPMASGIACGTVSEAVLGLFGTESLAQVLQVLRHFLCEFCNPRL